MGAKTPEKTSARSPALSSDSPSRRLFETPEKRETSTTLAVASFIGRSPTEVSDFLLEELGEHAEAVEKMSELATERSPKKLMAGLCKVAKEFNLRHRFPTQKLNTTAPTQPFEQSSSTMLTAVSTNLRA
jgi:hypothetical protein